MSIQDEINQRKRELELQDQRNIAAHQNKVNAARKVLPFVAEGVKNYAVNWAARAADKKPGIIVQGIEVARRHWFGKKYLKFRYRVRPGENYYIELSRCPEVYGQLANETCKKGMTNVHVSKSPYDQHIHITAELDME